MRYELIDKNAKHVDAIARAAKKADALYLATDPDREGEAISWHIAELLKDAGCSRARACTASSSTRSRRNAIQEAVEQPREIAQELVKAQQARRALDYLVGFNLSPLLWKKAGLSGASAGRVQCPALRMICEREEEIDAFKSRASTGRSTRSRTRTRSRSPPSSPSSTARRSSSSPSPTAARPKPRARRSRRRPAATLHVTDVEQEAAQAPSRAAVHHLHAAAGSRAQARLSARSARCASRRSCTKACDFGEGPVGLITYMRTDSVNLAVEAIREHPRRDRARLRHARAARRAAHSTARSRRTRRKRTRPCARPPPARTPEQVAGKLDPDEHRLYELIWRRAVACQMEPAVLNTVAVDLAAGRTTHSVPREWHDGDRARLPRRVPGRHATTRRRTTTKDRMLPRDGGRRPRPVARRSARTSISPSRRRASPKRAWSRRSRNTASAGLRPTRASSRRCCTRSTASSTSRRFVPTDVGTIVEPFPHRQLRPLRRLRLHRQDGGRARQHFARRGGLGAADGAVLGSPQAHRSRTSTRTSRAQDVAMAREIGTDPASGKPVSVRFGRYGAFAQIGTRDDEDKPKFASLRPAPAHAHDHARPRRWSCSSCRASSGETETATRSRSRSAASART